MTAIVSHRQNDLSGYNLEESKISSRGDVGSWPLLHPCPSITNLEITDYLNADGHIRGIIIETQNDTNGPRYAMYVQTSWHEEYRIWNVNYPARPRLYRDLSRLLGIIRSDYKFNGAIILRNATYSFDETICHKRKH